MGLPGVAVKLKVMIKRVAPKAIAFYDDFHLDWVCLGRFQAENDDKLENPEGLQSLQKFPKVPKKVQGLTNLQSF